METYEKMKRARSPSPAASSVYSCSSSNPSSDSENIDEDEEDSRILPPPFKQPRIGIGIAPLSLHQPQHQPHTIPNNNNDCYYECFSMESAIPSLRRLLTRETGRVDSPIDLHRSSSSSLESETVSWRICFSRYAQRTAELCLGCERVPPLSAAMLTAFRVRIGYDHEPRSLKTLVFVNAILPSGSSTPQASFFLRESFPKDYMEGWMDTIANVHFQWTVDTCSTAWSEKTALEWCSAKTTSSEMFERLVFGSEQ